MASWSFGKFINFRRVDFFCHPASQSTTGRILNKGALSVLATVSPCKCTEGELIAAQMRHVASDSLRLGHSNRCFVLMAFLRLINSDWS